jgi:hypothetical protein
MDILNFISWIKSSNYRTTLPTDVQSLLVIGAKDPSRDDGYLSLAINTAPLQSLYNKGTVTQLAVSTNPTAATGQEIFTFNNSNLTVNSTVLLTVEYIGTGFPIVSFAGLSAGSLNLIISNVDTLNALDSPVSIHFMIIN